MKSLVMLFADTPLGAAGAGLYKQFSADRMRLQSSPPWGANATAFACVPAPVRAFLEAVKAVTKSVRPVLSRWLTILASISASNCSLSCIAQTGKVLTAGALTMQEYVLPLFARN